MRIFHLATLFYLAFCSFPLFANSGQATERVSLQLKWIHSYQFAGYYAAKEKGFYAEEMLDVTIHERISGVNNIDQVLKNESQYGVSDTGLLEQRLLGNPVVILASIFQHNPLVYISLKKSGIVSPYELKGKRVMEDTYDNAPLLAMLYETGISSRQFIRLDNSFNPNDLINGKTDVMVGYLTDQVEYFKKHDIEINIIDPRNYGVDFLSDNLFTTEQEINQHPERVLRFLRASLKGWDYALKHQDEMIQLILDKYNPGNRLSADHLRFEAQETLKMILPETIPIGHTDIKRFQRIADTYQQLGLVKSTDHLEGFIYGQVQTGKIDFTPAEKNNIQNRWMSLKYEPGIKTRTFLLYAIAAILLLVFISSWNMRLRREISKKKRIEEQQRVAASVFTSTQEGIMITDAQGNIIDINPAFIKVTGYSRDDVLGHKPNFLKSGLHEDSFYKAMWQTITQKGHWCGEVWNRRKNGDIFAEWLTISAVVDKQGKITHYIGTSSDITPLKDHEKKLELIAHYDPLTGVPNRLLLADRMNLAFAQTKRDSCLMAIGYLDLDGFKAVNDKLGHEAGDQLLIQIAQRIKNALRDGDTIARLGGDEFVFLLLDLDKVEDCEITLHRLLETISNPILLSNQHVSVSASIGISIFPDDYKILNTQHQSKDYSVPDTLLRQADQAMYQAKQEGKNCFHIYNLELDRKLHAHREALDRIGLALENNEFELFFQPKFDMQKGIIFGAEALIRWQHPERGLLKPSDFLPLIDHSELAIKLDAWVIDQALQHMESWLSLGMDLQISVNVTARSLQAEDFILQLYYAFERYPTVNPADFELEILETQALHDLHLTSKVIIECQTLGIKFALDDFGTGYSSLSYLRHLPVETLKIDQIFVRDMLEDEDALAIVQGIIGLAKSFRRQVIAEGVESIEQGIALLKTDCRQVQGYSIAKPMPASEFAGWLKEWKVPAAWSGI